jgi:alcohol dehydrogenase
MTLSANWSFPTNIRFGAGRIQELPDACRETGMKRPLLVTDRGLAEQAITHSTLAVLADAKLDATLFADVDPNPSDTNLAAGVAAFRAGQHDGVIAFGGGSGLDLGKLVAFMSGQTRPVWDFEDIGDWWTRADASTIAPIIAVPTTAGTGSEVGRAGVVTNSDTKVKKIIFHPKALPSIVICDPELTVGMPQAITVGTGMDAFVHCMEAYCSPSYHPMAQGVALEGMRLVNDYLPRVHADPHDLEARAQMMSAAAMGATAFQKGLGAVHALAHPVGAHFNTHHGMTNAVIAPTVLRFNEAAVATKLGSVAAYLGVGSTFAAFLDRVLRLRSDLGVPDRLSGLGVADADINTLATHAINDPTAGANPIPLTQAAAETLYGECM